jgi:dTDP-4-dehydrorhamnose reductase
MPDNKTNNKTNIVVFGKNGQVASDLLKIFAKKTNFLIQNYGSKDVDFCDLEKLNNFLLSLPKLDFIVNATAYNNVDLAEDESGQADLINNQAVAILANFCTQNNIKLIHYSTNYIFDGKSKKPYEEDNVGNLKPLGVYGLSKLKGENAIIKSGCEYLIFRTATVFSAQGNNFVAKISSLAQKNKVLKIVDDQITNPTSSYDIAFYTIQIIEQITNNNFKSGIYNLVGKTPVSYYQFACKIIEKLRTGNIKIKTQEIIPVDSSEFPAKAQRPKNGALNVNKIEKDFGLEIRNWEEALNKIITRND